MLWFCSRLCSELFLDRQSGYLLTLSTSKCQTIALRIIFVSEGFTICTTQNTLLRNSEYLTTGRMVVCGDLLAWPVSDRFLSSTRVTALHNTMSFTMSFIQLPPCRLWWKLMGKSTSELNRNTTPTRVIKLSRLVSK